MNEKIDLSKLRNVLDNFKESTLRSKEYYKFIIGLSTGTLLISVTFIDKFSLLPAYKPLIVIGWICLIISIISGVWLLPKHDFLESEWKAIMDFISEPEKILLGIEQDFDKFITRGLVSGFLREEMSKDPKDEEKIRKLREEWLTPNGNKGKKFLNAMVSALQVIYPPLATAWPDITKEIGKWEKLMNKQGRLFYFPYRFRRIRKINKQVEVVQKVMAGSFYTGIILITLSSATSFLGVDLIGMICNLWRNIVSLTLYPRL